QVVCRTVMEDSLRSEGTSYQLLVATRTAEFGLNRSSVAISFALPNSSFAFPAGVTIDSVVLQAVYTGSNQYAGNLSTPMNIRVAEIDGRLYTDSGYFSDREVLTKGSTVNFPNIVHSLTDSVYLVENGNNVVYPPHLRLNLGQEMVDKMLNAQAGDLGSNTSFQDYFNGLKIEVDPSTLSNGAGNIVYLNLNHASSGLAV